MFLILAFVAFTQPTVHLMIRLSEEGRRERPISPVQEHAVARLSLAASMCGVGALAVGIISRQAGWPLGTRVAWLTASMIAAAVVALIGYGVRQTQLGRWGMRLSAAWGVFLMVYVLVALLRRAAGHT